MKALKIVLVVIGALVLIGGAGYLYASSGIKSKLGYADITPPRVASENALLAVNVGPGGVKPLRWAYEKFAQGSGGQDEVSDRALRSAFSHLQGVQLRVYDASGKRDVFDGAIADTAAALKGRSWETLLTVRDNEEQIMVLQFQDQNKIAGLSIMASTPDKAFFLNLIGPFDIEEIAASVDQL